MSSGHLIICLEVQLQVNAKIMSSLPFSELTKNSFSADLRIKLWSFGSTSTLMDVCGAAARGLIGVFVLAEKGWIAADTPSSDREQH